MKNFRRPFTALMALLIGLSFLAAIGCATGGGRGRNNFTEGVFIGVGQGFNGEIKAEVVFSSRAILQARIIEHRETHLFAEAPIERIPRQIVQYQTLNVDRVVGSTITSFAIVAAVEDAVVQANGDLSRLWATPAASPRSNEVVNLNVEMVIVGAGADGVPAAIAAAERTGEKIVLLEKMPGIGGAGIFQGWQTVANPTLSAPHRPLATQWHINEVNRRLFDTQGTFGPAAGAANRALFEQWRNIARSDWTAHNASHPNRVFDSLAFSIIFGGNPTESSVATAIEAADFMNFINENGMMWARPTIGTAWPRDSTPATRNLMLAEHYFRIFYNYIRSHNLPIDIKLETPATGLIVEGGRVVGVRARHAHGREYNIRANNVLLATGGFSANIDMVLEYAGAYWPELNRPNYGTTNHQGSQGDGIIMAVRDAGARTANLQSITVLPEGNLSTGNMKDIIGLASVPVLVNRDGLRFTNESWLTPGEGVAPGRNRISRAMFAQPDGIVWAISDSISNGIGEDGLNIFHSPVDHLFARGQAFRADTLEDLARQIGVPPAALVRTINEFNAAADAGICTQFIPNRVTFTTVLAPDVRVKTPPFYAVRRRPAVHQTVGGLVAVDGQVIRDSDGQPIPGLWAVGEVVDGIGGNRGFRQGALLVQRRIFP